ncbi:hypothetical protein [Brevundimonas sp.]|uniref:tetratricopeptide repeat protein n=1 Tax=Brevundimonas sp. TaxID=1871086 RepID=UPI002D0BCF12|nr:hypothetical protein [Brevundimonas sp.]HWQ88265.1 hypothetical protein [Brevundimonas sp.]
MTETSGPQRRLAAAGVIPYALAVGGMVLAWQIVIQPYIERAPVEAAIRIAPTSPLVLRRAAESELAAGRNDNAAALSRDALSRAPFDVKALRVVGLTEAKAGRLDEANEILTLAGNWSLRDDPTHAWLVEHRLRRGDYASAFAHADTLARRRGDLQPPTFRLFTLAATRDPQRVLPVLTDLLAIRPPWRPGYLTSLYEADGSLPVAANLAVLLQSTPAPLTTTELQEFYANAMAQRQVGIIKTVRARLNRPASGSAVTNGRFDDPTAPEPFQWSLVQKSGAVAEAMTDELRPSNPALRVEYDGYSAAVIAHQRVFLAPGAHHLRFQFRIESGEPTDRMGWNITCDPGGRSILSSSAVPVTGAGAWTSSAVKFSVPEGCPSQLLELRGRALDNRKPMVVWFDEVAIDAFKPTPN